MNSIGDFGYMAKTQVNFNGSTSKTAVMALWFI